MKTIDPQERLSDGWEPAPGPPLGPDLSLPPSPKLPILGPEAPTLCRQGPCIHYHELQTQLDAAKPIDGSAAAEFRHTIRTCYPHSGIEMPLDETPVFQCNLWLPADATVEGRRRTKAATDYLLSEPGKQYQAELAEWEAGQRRLRDESAAVQDTVVVDVIESNAPSSLIERMRKLHGSVELPLHTGVDEDTGDEFSCPGDCPRCDLQRRATEEEFE